MSRKEIVWVVVIALLGAGAYLIPHRGEGWKTYSNPEYGFSFSYPPDWTLKKGISEGGVAVAVGNTEGDLGVVVFARWEENLRLEDLREGFRAVMLDNAKLVGEENVEVSGFPAFRWELVVGQTKQELLVVVAKDIGYSLMTVGTKSYPEELFDRLMSTFSISREEAAF